MVWLDIHRADPSCPFPLYDVIRDFWVYSDPQGRSDSSFPRLTVTVEPSVREGFKALLETKGKCYKYDAEEDIAPDFVGMELFPTTEEDAVSLVDMLQVFGADVGLLGLYMLRSFDNIPWFTPQGKAWKS